MKVALCTLCLNEMEWLPALFSQHKDWPGLVQWFFVEAADRVYAEVNPTMVSKEGLSTDGTTEFLEELHKTSALVTHLKYGFCGGKDRAQGKCASRSAYLRAMEEYKPDYFVVLDADEFYPKATQTCLPNFLQKYPHTAFCLRHREVWRPPSLREQPLFQYEVVGGFWAIPYCRVWRWRPGLVYRTNHNTPEAAGRLLDRAMLRLDQQPGSPAFVHFGFAAGESTRLAKNRYYEERGESKDPKRKWYTESRAAWGRWQPGDELPHGAKVIPYSGPIPEFFTSVEVE